jgi:vancomycin resistance protein YoaR
MARPRLRRTPGDFAVLFTLLVICAALAVGAFWQIWHTQRIYTGVTIAGIPVGGMTRAAAMHQVNAALLRFPLPSITVSYGERQWPITGDDARVAADLGDAVNRAYLVGRRDTWSLQLNEQLAAALGGVDVAPLVELDRGQLRYVIGQIAGEVRRPARPAIQVGDMTTPAQPGADVDVEATVEELLLALQGRVPGQAVVVPLHVVELPAPATVAPAAAGAPAAAPTGDLPAPLLLRDPQSGLELALDAATVQTLRGEGNPPLIDDETLRAILTGWAAQIDVPARDARLRFDHATQSPVVISPSKPGRALNVEATLATARGALAAGLPTADLIVTPSLPAVDSNRVAEMGIRELVASGSTYFAGSSAARVRNIEVAAGKFVGIVIPPNGVFSFNEHVEDISAANGFEDSLIIWGDRTAVGIGGGVCQVSTTVFRAAFEGGFPIVERYNHGYIVDWYGDPGLDATIFAPTVDFRFRNDTGAHLLIEPVVDASQGVITFNFYGTRPDRQVTIGEPVQSNVQDAPPPLYVADDSLAEEQIKQVEWEKQGMTVTVERTIVENGERRTDTLVSKYQPWRAIYLAGPGVPIPTPVPTGEAAEPDATPEGVPTPEATPIPTPG